jgi:hypothetical protein
VSDIFESWAKKDKYGAGVAMVARGTRADLRAFRPSRFLRLLHHRRVLHAENHLRIPALRAVAEIASGEKSSARPEYEVSGETNPRRHLS